MKHGLLGKGSEAYVYGPFMPDSMRPYLKKQEMLVLDPAKMYVMKLYTSENIYPDSIDFWDKIRPSIRHDSFIIPVIVRRVPVSGLKDFQGFPPVRFKEAYMEIQEYGGQDFFYLLFERRDPLILSFKEFLDVWRSVIYMLRDAGTLITQKKMIVTDVKMENMVIKDNRLRIIDAQINPESQGVSPFRIVTPQIGIMPVQYFETQWKTRGDARIRQIYDKKSQKIYNDPNNKLYDILHFIHGDLDSYKDIYDRFLVNPTTQAEKTREKFFFVIYPLFIMILILEKFGHIRYEAADKIVISNIIRFCLDTLKKRGVAPSRAFFQEMIRVARNPYQSVPALA